MDDKSVNYLAVARLPAAGSEAVLLAERVHRRGGGYEYRDHVIQVLNSPGWAEVQSDRLSLQDGLYKFHLLIDEPTGLVFLAVATLEYPGRHVFGTASTRGCLPDLRDQFLASFRDVYKAKQGGDLTMPASVILKSLCKTYNDLKNIDKLERVKAQVQDVALLMHSSLEGVADLSDKMDSVVERSDQLRILSTTFEREARAQSTVMKKKNRKLTILIVVITLCAIAIAIIVYMALRKANKSLHTAAAHAGNVTTL